MQVLERLKDMIASQLDDHIEAQGSMTPESIDSNNIEIDFPDPDNMKRNSMLYIQPDNETLETLSMSSDLATMNASVFILCKGSRNAALICKVFGYHSALYRMLRGNQTLSGYIEGVMITDMDYYPQVTASKTVTAIEVHLQMQWAKEF